MHNLELEAALRDFTLGGLRFFETVGSTNDEALAWAASDASDAALVVADTQSSGRGRDGRKWISQPGAGLAFSLILRPTQAERELVGRFAGLASLALVEALARRGLAAEVKWPNDVLIGRRKVAGVLVEAVWTGADVESLVIGMGVNVAPGSLPPAAELNFPATCVETELGRPVIRYALLRELLNSLLQLRTELVSDTFLARWEQALAFRGEQVLIWQGRETQAFTAELIGLDRDGSLSVRLGTGETRRIHFGEVHVRPAAGQ
jgi:BirA family biotin operon repressor/biotin-[acetyl-CoA-carboxylase] ligase